MTFNEVLAQLKSAASKQAPKVNKELIETNKEVAATVPNNELIETNSQRNIEVLNAIGLSETEFHVLKKNNSRANSARGSA